MPTNEQLQIKPLKWQKGTCYPSDKETDISYSCIGRYQAKFRHYFGEERDVWTVFIQTCGDFNCSRCVATRKTLKGAKSAAEAHYIKQMMRGLEATNAD